MPLYFDRSLGTSINIDSDTPTVSNTTFTSARKFFAPDGSEEQEYRGVDYRSNDEHLIEQAASMKGVAVAAESIADQARLALESMRGQLGDTSGAPSLEIRQQLPGQTEFDVAATADVRANRLANILQGPLGFLNTRDIANDLHKNVPFFVFAPKVDVPAPPAFNPVVPQFDGVTVAMGKQRGTVDCFYTQLKFSLPLQQVWNGKIKAIRIFRTSIFHPVFQRGQIPIVTMHGMERLSTLKMRSRSKGLDQLSSMEHRFREAGIPNSLSILNPRDPQTNLRLAASLPDSFTQTTPNSSFTTAIVPRALPQISSFLNPNVFGKLDPSVGLDPNVIRNIQNQNPAAGNHDIPQTFNLNTAAARRQGLFNPSQVSNLRPNGSAPIVIDENNKQEFRELAFFSLEKLKSTIVDDVVHYEYVDETVGYGRGYKYYIVSVDKDMIESVRSQIVNVTIEGIRIPERPKRVFSYNVQDAIAFNVLVDDQLVEKFEIFRREADRALIKEQSRISTLISDVQGFNVSLGRIQRGENNFIKIGECLNGTRGTGATYYDREIVPGRKYLYRIYSVDVFGNKSESPYEVEMFVPDRVAKPNELVKPALTVEVDSETNKAKLVFKCTDSRVRTLFVARRNLTIGQAAFTTPSQVNVIKFGLPKAGEGALHFEDVLLRGEKKDVAWTGYFENDTNEITYIDRTVSLDHVYQYRIYGVDLYGNATPYETSQPVMITRRPLISAPVNVTAEVVQGPEFTVGGVKLTWQDGNVDISSEDRLGNRDDLNASSVRTLYQVERKKVGEERWVEFPMIEERTFFDPSPSSLGDQKPNFRPPLVETHQTYVYRVKALQTGSYVSNYSTYVEVFSALPVVPPSNFRVRVGDTKVKPFYAVLNWDTRNDSGVVDKWEIERAELNNFAAARLNVRNPSDFRSLDFRPFRSVFREASRFRAQGIDQILNVTTGIVLPGSPPTIFTGQHQFQDTDVRFGNTYFYRIKAIGVDGTESSWVYRGIKLTDENTEKIVNSFLTDEMKRRLTAQPIPLVINGRFQSSPLESFSFQPQFSKPDAVPSISVIAPTAVQTVAPKPSPLPTYNFSSSPFVFSNLNKF